jgi:hypothetical protein
MKEKQRQGNIKKRSDSKFYTCVILKDKTTQKMSSMAPNTFELSNKV